MRALLLLWRQIVTLLVLLALPGCFWVDADSKDVSIPLKNVGGAMRVKILEYNILSTADRNAVASGYAEWEDRRDEMFARLDVIPFDIAAFEESAPLQAADLYRHFKDEFNFVIADDVSTDAILMYAKSRFELIESGRWLLDHSTLHIPRVAVWASLRDIVSRREFFVVSVHFDANRIKKQEITAFNDRIQKPAAWGVPVFIAGDFNISPADPEYARLINYGWKDAHMGEALDATFPSRRPRIRIDHIFWLGQATTSSDWQIQKYHRAYDMSDHFPIVSRLETEASPDWPLGPTSSGQ